MPKRLIITKVCFHITAVLLVLGAVAMAVMFGPLVYVIESLTAEKTPDMDTAMMMSGIKSYAVVALPVMAGLVAGLEFVIYSLSRLRYWAWITGIVICGLLILPVLHGNVISAALGGLALWGLVDPDSVKAFKPNNEPVNNAIPTEDCRPSTED